jgi:uncharacterized protein (TIGR02246 family)
MAMTADDERAIRDLIETWHRATAAGDLGTVLTLMDDDVVFLGPGRPPMRGKDAFAAGFRAATGSGRLESAGRVQEIRIADDWAYCWTELSVVKTPEAGGAATRLAGPTLTIFRKAPGGTWVLFRDANMLSAEDQTQ